MTATKAQAKVIVDSIKTMTNLTANLYVRWRDERDHEDISEYADAIKRNLPSEIVFDKMTKRPFGFQVHLKENPSLKVAMTAKVSGSKCSVSYRQVK